MVDWTPAPSAPPPAAKKAAAAAVTAASMAAVGASSLSPASMLRSKTPPPATGTAESFNQAAGSLSPTTAAIYGDMGDAKTVSSAAAAAAAPVTTVLTLAGGVSTARKHKTRRALPHFFANHTCEFFFSV